MVHWSPTSLLRGTEVAYASIALFFLTQGPVYRLWTESAGYLSTSPEPTIPHAYFATFVVVQLPALLLLGRRMSDAFLRRKSTIALIGLIVWLAATLAWSTLARRSVPEFVALVCTTSFGLYLVTRFSLRTMWWITLTATGTGLLLSLFSVLRGWAGSVDSDDDYWIGIYFNRNSLAPVAAVALIAAIAVIVTNDRRDRWFVSSLMIGIPLAVLSTIVLWQTESRTSPFALGIALSVVILRSVLRWLTARSGTLVGRWSPTLITLLIVAVGVSFALRTIGSLSGVSGETTTFNSRGSLWSLSWSGFQIRPWQGWGWQAAWHTPEFFRQGVWWAAWDTTWSHSGYFDLLLGGGVLAAILFVAYIATSARRFDSETSRESAIRLLLLAFVLAAATQESFFIGSHFLWALLVASASGHRSPSDVSVDEHHSGEWAT